MPNNQIIAENFVQKVGAFIKEKRQALGWDQKRLATEAFGNPEKRKFISLIESGKKEGLTLDTVEKLFKAMNCEIDFKEYNF